MISLKQAFGILSCSAILMLSAAPAAFARETADQLDMFDEPPVGEQRIMRNKKHNYLRTHPAGPFDSIIDLGIIVTGSGLVGIVAYVLASRRRYVRPPVSD